MTTNAFGLEGQVLVGRYRLVRRLSSGSMGTVWCADDLTLGSPVAVKMLSPLYVKDDIVRARFYQEAHAAAALRSPNVVQILDHGVDNDVPFIAMELLEGEDLAARLQRVGALPPAEITRIFADVARAVRKAHDAGIVHRDLKPDNIFLARDDDREVAKVLDFGVARTPLFGEGMGTQAGALIGTLPYMSPEQARGATVDYRSDLWALGVIAFECVCGRAAISAEAPGAMILEICGGDLPVPSQVASVPVPPAFDDWFMKACSREPSERFSSATAMAEALRAALLPAGEPSETERASQDAVPSVSFSAPRSRSAPLGDDPAPRSGGAAQRNDDPAPRSGGAVLTGDDVAPRSGGAVLTGDDPAPRSGGAVLTGDDPAPRSGGAVLTGDDVAPRSGGAVLTGDDVAPRSGGAVLTGDDPAPRSGEAAPRSDRAALPADEASPTGDDAAPESELAAAVAPRGSTPDGEETVDWRPRRARPATVLGLAALILVGAFVGWRALHDGPTTPALLSHAASPTATEAEAPAGAAAEVPAAETEPGMAAPAMAAPAMAAPAAETPSITPSLASTAAATSTPASGAGSARPHQPPARAASSSARHARSDTTAIARPSKAVSPAVRAKAPPASSTSPAARAKAPPASSASPAASSATRSKLDRLGF
ncbi:protein kinase [Sorangium sp. So ce1036]|uniref:serine/threonine-protein kinase n=1 Tax=Sorangium sp. So ce1036 TaxID=3133328 RepID=UPI003F11BE92